MGRFITADTENPTGLTVVKIAEPRRCWGRAVWRLREPLAFTSDVLGRMIVVPAGRRTDFASVPRFAIAFAIAGDTGHAAAVIHDWLYHATPCSRGQADAVFREALAAEGAPLWRRWLMFVAVRCFGWLAWGRKETP